jgi:hypothetical protein
MCLQTNNSGGNMSNHCSTHGHHCCSHSKDHQHSCKEHHSCCGCGENCPCGCQCKEGQKGKNFAHQILEMADEAWMEVLHDKIKEHVLAHCGTQLDELAKIAAESNGARWKHKKGAMQEAEDFDNKVDDFFRNEK